MLFDLASDNENQRDFYQHMRRYAFSIIMINTFGTRVKNWDHPDAQDAVRSQAILRRTSQPGTFLVDELPPLASLPKWLQPGQKEAKEAAKEVLDIKIGFWRRLEKQAKSGQAPHCYTREIYESKESWYAQELTEEHLAWVFSGLVEAGFETTAATLNSLILHLAANQRVPNKAQEELMRVVGPDRLPTFGDVQNLPYVRACTKEMLRMNPILSPGIWHFAGEDVTYKGHVIPKGTVLLANTAFLHCDPRFEKRKVLCDAQVICCPVQLSFVSFSLLFKVSLKMSSSSWSRFDIVTGVFTIMGGTLALVAVGFAIAHCFGWKFYKGKPPPQDVELTARESVALVAIERSTLLALVELRLLNDKANRHERRLPLSENG